MGNAQGAESTCNALLRDSSSLFSTIHGAIVQWQNAGTAFPILGFDSP